MFIYFSLFQEYIYIYISILPSESVKSSNFKSDINLTSIDNNGDDCLLAIINADSCMYFGITGWAPASNNNFTISLRISYLIANSKLV